MTAFNIQTLNNPLRILLIEDDEGDRDLALEYLKEDNSYLYQVTWANSLETGLKKLKAERFDAIILDLVLPDSRGVTTVSKLCARSGNTPVIVSSYFDENTLASKVIELGAQDYLAKDLMDSQTLGRTMSRALARAKHQAAQISDRREAGNENASLVKKVQQLQSDIQRLEAIASNINDTTDGKAALEESRQRMIRTLSHECRSPATVVLLATSILKSYDAQVDDVQYLAAIARIDDAVKQMMHLLDNALSFDRARAVVSDDRPRKLDLKLVCQRAIAQIESKMKPSPAITTNYIGDCLEVCLYQEMVESILEQLLMNAVLYSPGPSPIVVTIETKKQQVVIAVQDKGRGMTETEKENAFEAFYRASHVDNIHGLGLGLTIVATCANLCGGDVNLESEVGKGTTVTVNLPIVQ